MLLMPFPLGLLGLGLLAMSNPDGAAILLVWNLTPLVLLWGLLCTIFYYVRKSSGRAASALSPKH